MEQMKKKKAAQRKKFGEAYAKEKAAKASGVQSEKAFANTNKEDIAVTRSEETRVDTASSAKCAAEDTQSFSEESPLAKQKN